MNVLINILRKLNLVPVPLVDTASQLIRARAVLEANKLGVFAALENGNSGLSLDDLCSKVNISHNGAEVLLSALAATGYVHRQNGHYKNSRWVRRWITDPERGLSNYLLLQTDVWSRLEQLGPTLQAGMPTSNFHQAQVAEHSAEQEVYTKAMRELASYLLPDFLRLAKLPPGARRLLDIGGAHGEYSRALVRRHAGLKATVFDLPGPIASAEAIHAAEGNPEELTLRGGDALTDDLGSDWDAVLLANVVHIFSPEQNQLLFARIAEALAPGGKLIIMDQFTGVGRARDVLPSLLSLNFFNIGGRCYARGDMQRLLRQAGYSHVAFKKTVPWRPIGVFEASV